MIIERGTKFLRMYQVNGRFLSKIHFFDKNGIVVSSFSGWLEHHRNDVGKITLQQETIKVKRKIDFNTKNAFLVSTKKDYDNEKYYDLYIPFDQNEWEMSEEWKEDCFNPAYETLIKTYHNSVYNATIEVRTIKRDTNKKPFIDSMTEISSLCHYDNKGVSQSDMIKNKDRIIELMKEIIKTL